MIKFDISKPITKDPNFEIRSRVAVDRAPIAPFRKLEKGFDISTIPSAYLDPPLSISTITRALVSRVDSNIETEPLIVTDIASRGPDADFSASITTISSLASAIDSENPISVPFYKIENNIYFDEPLLNEYNPWSPIFRINDLKISPTNSLDITSLSKIASHALREGEKDEWFGALKDGIEISERANQRFYRETENLLPKLTEHFSRSFECTSVSQKLSLHVGTNSIICSVDGGKPCILEYSRGEKDDPLLIQRNNQWYIEAILSACPRIIYSSSDNGKITRFDEIEAPVTLSLEGVFNFLEFLRSNLTSDSGLYLINKNVGDSEIKILKVEDEKIRQSGLKDLYENRYAMLEMFVGFRRSLSKNPTVVDSAQRLLIDCAQIFESTNSALCLERVADSIILPILLLNRRSSLIAKPLENQTISESELNEASNLYEAALDYEDLPDLLIKSLNEKILTTEMHRAQLLESYENAQEVIDRAYGLEHTDAILSFICQCDIWCGKNAIGHGDIDKAIYYLDRSKVNIKTDEDRVYYALLNGNIASAKAQLLLSEGKIEEANDLFESATKNFEYAKSDEDIALSWANSAHIERQRAMKCTVENHGTFTLDEETHLNKARDLYQKAIKLSTIKDHRQSMMIDLASLYVSVVIRFTQAPPVDRMPVEKIIDFVDSTVNAARAMLRKSPQNSQVAKQEAALDVWSARFNAYIKYPTAKSKDEARRIFSSAINGLDRARRFFIADNYPADFISITMTKADLYLNENLIKEALNEMITFKKVLRPTTVSIAGHKTEHPQSNEMLKGILPEIVQLTREILKAVLKELMMKKKNTSTAKDAYAIAIKATPETIINAIERAQNIKL